MTTGKTIALTRQTFVGKVMSLFFKSILLSEPETVFSAQLPFKNDLSNGHLFKALAFLLKGPYFSINYILYVIGS